MSKAAPYLERVPEGWSILSTHNEKLDAESVPMLIASSYGILDDYQEVLVDGALTVSILPGRSISEIPKDGVLVVVSIVVSSDDQDLESLASSIDKSQVFKSKAMTLSAEGLSYQWTGRDEGQASRMVLDRAIDENRVDVVVYFGSLDPAPEEIRKAQDLVDQIRMPSLESSQI